MNSLVQAISDASVPVPTVVLRPLPDEDGYRLEVRQNQQKLSEIDTTCVDRYVSVRRDSTLRNRHIGSAFTALGTGHAPFYFRNDIGSPRFSGGSVGPVGWRETPQEALEYCTVKDEIGRELAILGHWLSFQFLGPNSEKSRVVETISEQVRPKINELIALAYGWDSYNALPVQDDVVECVYALLEMLGSYTQIKPDIVPLRNGGLQLEWFVGDHELEVSIEPGDRICVYYEQNEDQETAQEFILDSPQDDEQIAPILRALSY